MEDGAPYWRRTLTICAASQVFSLLGFSFVVPFLPLYIQTLGVHGIAHVTLWAALLSGGSAVCMAVAAPIWGALADRHGRKIMVVRAACSAGILVGLMGLAQNVWQLLALRMLQGMFTGTVSASQALVSSQTPRKHMGFSLGIMQTAIFVGNSIGPLVGGVVADAVGFRPSFFVAGVLLFGSGVLVALFVREELRPQTGRAQPAFWRDLGGAMKIPALPAMIATYFAIQFGATIVFPILPQFVQALQGPADHAATITGFMLAGAGVAGAVSSVTAGFISDRVGFKAVLIVSSFAAAILSVPQFFVTTTWQLFVLRVLIGLAVGAMMPSASALTASLVPASRRGTAYGLTGSATSIGMAIGPLTAAGVVSLGGIRPVFLTTAVVLLLISLWVAMMVRGPEETYAGGPVEAVDQREAVERRPTRTRETRVAQEAD